MPLSIGKMQYTPGGIRKPSEISDANWAKIQTIQGPMVNLQYVKNQGGTFAKYANNWVYTFDYQWTLYDWSSNGSNMWAEANYYDRVASYYNLYYMTGDAQYKAKAELILNNYVYNYIIPNGGAIIANWSMPRGMAMGYLMTGNTDYKYALGLLGDYLSLGYYYNNHRDGGSETDLRQSGYCLKTFVLCDMLGVTSNTDYTGNTATWAQRANTNINDGYARQYANGAYNQWFLDPNNGNANTHLVLKPFMCSLYNDALMLYQRNYGYNANANTMIVRSVDWMNNYMWVESNTSYYYIEYDQQGETNSPAPDLNCQISVGMSYAYSATGNTFYRDRTLAIIDKTMDNLYIVGTKQINEAFSFTHNAIAYTIYG